MQNSVDSILIKNKSGQMRTIDLSVNSRKVVINKPVAPIKADNQESLRKEVEKEIQNLPVQPVIEKKEKVEESPVVEKKEEMKLNSVPVEKTHPAYFL